MSEQSFQAGPGWICPFCFDDHSQSKDCKQEDLKKRIIKLLVSGCINSAERAETINKMIELL